MPEVANRGMVRPPLVYLSAIAFGVLLHFAWPLRLVSPTLSMAIGAPTVVVAVALFVWSVRTLRIAGTPVPGDRPTTAIVRAGPYRFSRNPIYLAFSLFQLGVACWLNSLWLVLTLVPAVALMSFVVVPREERYLELRFPTEYPSYKRAVRRWL